MPDAMEQCLARQQSRRNSPDYKPFIDAENQQIWDNAEELSAKMIHVRQMADTITPYLSSSDFATWLELIDHSLTAARETSRQLRRAAKLIVARREREEKGVFRP